MALSSSASRRYRLVDNQVDASAAIKALAASKLMALDCEGVDLSRYGELCTLQLRSFDPPDHMPFVYVFDVLTLGRWLFDVAGLRRLLENEEVVKLMYDCRNDSDALQHQFGVRLAGVRDLQLLGYMLSPSSHRLLMGLGKALTKYVAGYSGASTKTTVTKLFEEDKSAWKRRPLTHLFLEYCANDVFYFYDMYKHFSGRIYPSNQDSYVRRWVSASKNYVDVKRSLLSMRTDKYLSNPFLPLRIIPEDRMGQLVEFLPAQIQCNGCRRSFHRSEMSGSKCIVCDMVDQRV